MPQLRWSFNREVDEWEALDPEGEQVGRAYVREGTPTGYYGRYAASGCGYKGFPSTLREAKQAIQAAYDRRAAENTAA